MMFFPTKLTEIKERTERNDVFVDESYIDLEADLVQLGEAAFDREFEAIYAKMLRIGTSNLGPTIANRPRGENCPVQ
jgi:hypothetical protein